MLIADVWPGEPVVLRGLHEEIERSGIIGECWPASCWSSQRRQGEPLAPGQPLEGPLREFVGNEPAETDPAGQLRQTRAAAGVAHCR